MPSRIIIPEATTDRGHPKVYKTTQTPSTSILHLPIEVLTRVLILGEPGDVHRFPLAASHVCRHWRAIALQTPALWTTITIYGPKDPSPAILQHCLSLSASRPIDVIIQLHNHLTREEVRLNLQTISDHSRRWRTLSIVSQTSTHSWMALEVLRSLDAPILRGLKLDLVLAHQQDYEIHWAGILALATFHCHLSRSRFWLGLLPATKLSSFRWSCGHNTISYELFTQVLKHLGQLRALSLSGKFISDREPYSRHDVVLPNLVALHVQASALSGVYSNDIHDIFRTIVAPKLQTLSFTADLPVNLAEFQTCLCNDGAMRFPELQMLEFPRNTSRYRFSFDALARALPSFVEVSGSPRIMSALYDSFRTDPARSQEADCRISTLRFHGDVECDELKTFLGARAACGKPVKTLRFHRPVYHRIPISTIAWLKQQTEVEIVAKPYLEYWDWEPENM